MILAAVAALAAAFAPRAEAFIYWADSESDRIGRANNDGTNVDPSFITVSGDLVGVAVDGGHIYWGNATAGSIGRANLDGTGVEQSFIAGAGSGVSRPVGVAVDGSSIWWSNFQFSPDPGSIGHANLDGTDADPNMFISPQVENPCGVAVRAEFVYWPNAGSEPPTIARSGVSGTPPPDSNFVPNAGTLPCRPAVSDSHIYWAFSGGIARADLAGMNVEVVLGSNGYGGTAIHGSTLYFANNTEGTISRANLDGSSPEFAFITGAGNPTGLAVDSGFAAPGASAEGGACDDLTLDKAKRNKKKGTATLAAEVGCAGTVEIGGGGIKSAEKQADGAGTVELPVKAKGKKKKKLNQQGKAKVEAEVSFTPVGGAAISQDAKVKLVKK